MKKCVLIFCAFFLLATSSPAQKVMLEGYVFEDGTQNYLSGVNLSFYDDSTGLLISTLTSEKDGYFNLEIDQNKEWRIKASKEFFKTAVLEFESKSEKKSFVRMSMSREEGYLLTVDLIQPRDSINGVLKKVYGAELSVVNNTLGIEVVDIPVLTSSIFSVPMVKGNHYTIMIRKENFLKKRIQSYVDIDGCVLCFEGIDRVKLVPNDSVYQSLSMGTLFTDVELLPLFKGQTIDLNKVRFSKGNSLLSLEAKAGLQELAEILEDNPEIVVEIASHSAARGNEEANLKLTQIRADLMVEFLTNDLGIGSDRVFGVGYGGTQVRNRCKRGVNCSDSEHDENRRTVARIIDVESEDSVDENNHNEIVLKEDLPIPSEEPKDVIADNKIELDSVDVNQGLAFSEETEIGEQIDSLDQLKLRQKKEAIVEIVESAVALKKPVSGTNSDVLEIIDLEEKMEKEATDTVTLDNNDVSKLDSILQDTLEAVEFQDVGSDDLGEAVSPFDDFSGFSIVIHFSNFPIPANHEIYKDFGEVESYITREKNVLYLLGTYATFEVAEAYLTDQVKPKIPGAYIVRFVNGKKIKVK
jgi:outer membrane protein OmpA-like peptidoglycan-associated protein